MITVGIRELKAQLSAYVRKAKLGETIVVTDRGEVVAELRAPTAPARGETPAQRKYREGVESGEIHPAVNPGDWSWLGPNPGGLPYDEAVKLAQEYVDFERDEDEDED